MIILSNGLDIQVLIDVDLGLEQAYRPIGKYRFVIVWDNT
jgi:hypothetical protein